MSDVISRDQAEAAALAQLGEATDLDGIERVFAAAPDDLDGYWVFYYQSRRYMESGEIDAMLVGNAPIVVPKDGSATFHLSTAESIDAQLERLQRGPSSAP